MDRSDFLKSFGLGTAAIVLPTNSFLQSKAVKIYDNYVRGITYYQFTKCEQIIKEGDTLELRREPDNIYDSFAIEIFYKGFKMGYIAAYENIVLANMLDAGVKLSAFVSKIRNNRIIYEALAICVYTELMTPTSKLINSMLAEKRADDAFDIYRSGHI